MFILSSIVEFLLTSLFLLNRAPYISSGFISSALDKSLSLSLVEFPYHSSRFVFGAISAFPSLYSGASYIFLASVLCALNTSIFLSREASYNSSRFGHGALDTSLFLTSGAFYLSSWSIIGALFTSPFLPNRVLISLGSILGSYYTSLIISWWSISHPTIRVHPQFMWHILSFPS